MRLDSAERQILSYKPKPIMLNARSTCTLNFFYQPFNIFFTFFINLLKNVIGLKNTNF